MESRPYGGAYVLDGLWRRVGVDGLLAGLLAGNRRDQRAERVLFALVANRALAPSSKLAATRWVNEWVLIDGLVDLDDDTCYRAMDWLLEVEAELAERVYWAVSVSVSVSAGPAAGGATSSTRPAASRGTAGSGSSISK